MASPIAAGALRIGSSILRGAKSFRRGVAASVDVGVNSTRRTFEKINNTNKKIKVERKKQDSYEREMRSEDSRRDKESSLERKRAVPKVGNMAKRLIKAPFNALIQLLAAWAIDNLPYIIKQVQIFVKKIKAFKGALDKTLRGVGNILKSLKRIVAANLQNLKELDFSDSKGRVQAAWDEFDKEKEEFANGWESMGTVWTMEEEELDRFLEGLERDDVINDTIKNLDTTVEPQNPAVGPQPVSTSASGAPIDPNNRQAFKFIYDLAKKYGAKYPEVAAAKSMQETGYLVNPQSIYFNTGKTNAFGQTVELRNKSGWAARGITGYIKSDGKLWAVYDSIESSVRDHVNLWHKTRPGMKNFNDYDTVGGGVREILKDYSPDSDPENVKRGFTENIYGSSVMGMLRDVGIDPRGGAGQQLNDATANAGMPEVEVQKPKAPPQPEQKQEPVAVPMGDSLSDVLYSKDFNTTDRSAPSPIIKTSGRGERWGRHHGGIDFAPPAGQRGWYCALRANGKVTFVGTLPGYGKTVIIQVGNVDLLFAHLAQYAKGIKNGAPYKSGQPIGEVGSTGKSSGIHLHYEARPVGGRGGSDIPVEPYVKLLIFGKLNRKVASKDVTMNGNSNMIADATAASLSSNRTGSGTTRQHTSVITAVQPIYS